MARSVLARPPGRRPIHFWPTSRLSESSARPLIAPGVLTPFILRNRAPNFSVLCCRNRANTPVDEDAKVCDPIPLARLVFISLAQPARMAGGSLSVSFGLQPFRSMSYLDTDCCHSRSISAVDLTPSGAPVNRWMRPVPAETLAAQPERATREESGRDSSCRPFNR